MATFTNQATLTYNGVATNSNIVTGEVTEILSATKTALDNCFFADGEITYVVTLTNTGATPLTGLTVTDDLGTYTTTGTTPLTLTPLAYEADSVRYFVNGIVQASPTATATTNSVTFTGITVPANSNAMLIYNTTANEFAPLTPGATIENTATVTGAGVINTVAATDTLPVCSQPRLDITKAISPSVVSDNGQITYTLTILNYGNTAITATDDVVITDTFDPILNPISVSYNGTAWTASANYTYDATTGLFTTQPNQITVPAATYTQDPVTGAYTVTPGTAVITITGTV